VIFIRFSRTLRTLEDVRSSMTAVATVVAMLLLAVSSPAQQESRPDGFLRVQWHVVELPEPIHIRLEGYVYNTSPLRVSDVRLHVVERDSAAHEVGEAWGWVFGDVPAVDLEREALARAGFANELAELGVVVHEQHADGPGRRGWRHQHVVDRPRRPRSGPRPSGAAEDALMTQLRLATSPLVAGESTETSSGRAGRTLLTTLRTPSEEKSTFTHSPTVRPASICGSGALSSIPSDSWIKLSARSMKLTWAIFTPL
jgi:hypothetical protein